MLTYHSVSVVFSVNVTLDSETLRNDEGDNLVFVAYMYIQLFMIHLCQCIYIKHLSFHRIIVHYCGKTYG